MFSRININQISCCRCCQYTRSNFLRYGRQYAAVVTCVSVLLFINSSISTGERFTTLVSNAVHASITKPTQLSPMATATTDEIDPDSESTHFNRSTSRIFYNRVPKCGSSSTLQFLGYTARQNNAHIGWARIYTKPYLKSDDELQDFLKSFYKVKEPVLYNRHLYFIDFESLGHPSPIYINLIRDPLDRMHSWYYFRRFSHPRKLTAEEKKQSFNDCVLFNKTECVDPHGGSAEHGWWNIIPYFCGQHTFCLHPSRRALEHAQRNVIRYYSVVGVLESYHPFIHSLECIIPDYFQGIYEYMRTTELTKKKATRTRKKPPFSKEVENIMKEKMKLEYEFYDFVRKRFQHIYEALPCSKKDLDPTHPKLV